MKTCLFPNMTVEQNIAFGLKMKKVSGQSFRRAAAKSGSGPQHRDEAMIMSDVIQLFHEGRIEQSGNPISMYTEPRTRFAAGFIGNYNILDAGEFSRLTGTTWAESRDVAIRPETISLSRTPNQVKDAYRFEGIVKNNIPRGNVLRYDIEVNGVQIQADVLFRSFQLFENGTRVYGAVERHNCLKLA